MRIRILGWAAAACLLAAPAASAEADDACVDAAAEVVREMEAGPAAPLSARERGLVIAASVRACRSAAGEADAATADEADAATATEPDPARGTVLLDGSEPRAQGLRSHLERWLADPVECERVKRPNGRWVRICE